MSYFECPDCKRKTELFGKSRAEAAASETGTQLLGRLPIMPKLAQMSDEGKIEAFETMFPGFFDEVTVNLLADSKLKKIN